MNDANDNCSLPGVISISRKRQDADQGLDEKDDADSCVLLQFGEREDDQPSPAA